MSAESGSSQLESCELVLLRRIRGYGGFADEGRERIFREHLPYVLDLVAAGGRAGPRHPGRGCGDLRARPVPAGSLAAARELMDGDRGVRQGLFRYDVMTWQTPAGRISFRNP